MITTTFVYNRTHTSVFVAENMRNLLRDLISWSGLSPTKLVDDWKVLGNAIQTWLQTGDLLEITIEFFVSGAPTAACRRWDFPIAYDGSGSDDDMWVARDFVRRTLEKVGLPPPGAEYTVILLTRPGRPDVPGMMTTEYRSTAGLIARSSGTAIATPDIMASLKYWRPA